MTDQHGVVVGRWPERTSVTDVGLAGLLTAYHLATEAEKGRAVADADGLPERYRAETLDPRTAFADDTVWVARSGDTAVGCVVVTAPHGQRPEIKRLWTDPVFRGRGVASDLIGAALAHCAESGADGVRLSVWQWRADAIALYERLGFTVTEPWDVRDRLVCMERVESCSDADGWAGP